MSVNGKLSTTLNVMGSYTLARANTNGAGGTASNAFNLDQDYGRASFVSRNMLFLMSTYTGPWGIRFNPFIIAQSGRPFNVTLPTDPLNNLFNQRPGVAASSDCASSTGRYVTTTLGCFDTHPVSGEQLAPINLGNGPAAVAVNLRISKAIGFGPKLGPTTPQADGGPPQGGPPSGGGGPGGGRGGPGIGGPGGGLGPGGLGGGGGRGPGGMGGSVSTGHKYSLNLSVQALNVFNNINYGMPNGTLTTTTDPVSGEVVPGSQFGKSTNLAGGIFSTGSAARRIFAQAVFSF